METSIFDTVRIENNENDDETLIDFVDNFENRISLSRAMCLLAQETLRTKKCECFDGYDYHSLETLEDLHSEMPSWVIRSGDFDSMINFTKDSNNSTILIGFDMTVYGDELYYEDDTGYREYEILGEDEFNITVPYELFMNYQF